MPRPLRPPSRRFTRVRPLSTRFATPFGRGRATLAGGQIEYTWRGRKIIEAMVPAVERAMQRARDDAQTYWREVIWTKENHPYMTGTERDAGRFDVQPSGNPLRVDLRGYVDMDEEYPIYEEFGTTLREGHFPLRRTMDWVAPRIRGYLREELSAATEGAP